MSDNDAITEYGTWNNLVGGSTANLEDSVAEYAGEHADDYDLDEVAAQYRAAINAVLPEGVTLEGDMLYGPYADLADFDMEEAGEAVGEIDLGAIFQRCEIEA